MSQLCNCDTLNEHCEIPLIVMTNISISVWILISCGAVRHSSAFFALLYRRAFSHRICVPFDSLASMQLTVTWTCVVTVDFWLCLIYSVVVIIRFGGCFLFFLRAGLLRWRCVWVLSFVTKLHYPTEGNCLPNTKTSWADVYKESGGDARERCAVQLKK